MFFVVILIINLNTLNYEMISALYGRGAGICTQSRTNPNRECCCYTTPRTIFLVGVPRIELGLHDPQPCVLPLYDTPFKNQSIFIITTHVLAIPAISGAKRQSD